MQTHAREYLLLDHIQGLGKKGAADLLKEGITPGEVIKRYNGRIERQKEKEESVIQLLDSLEDLRLDLVTWESNDYPQQIREIPDPPAYFFKKGDFIPEDVKAVAIVGTRNMTIYGKAVTEKIVTELVAAGVTIVSGFMRGIDTVAHQIALREGGRTIAVLGTGFNHIVPPENKQLVHKVANGGVILSEFLPDTKAQKFTFPMRNRIVAGLSKAIVVIEAGERSGALITAQLGLEQNKEIFAVPGSIFSPQSEGTNWLLSQGAHLAKTAHDILDVLGLHSGGSSQSRRTLIQSQEEKLIFDLLAGGPLHGDDIVRRSGLDTSVALSTLSMMELKGMVKNMGESVYIIS